MSSKNEVKPWVRIRELSRDGDREALGRYAASLAPGELVHAMFRLGRDEQKKLLTMLAPDEAAHLIDEIPDEHAAEIIEDLEAEDAAAILNEMDSNDQADILGEMDDEGAQAILAKMAPGEAEHARLLLSYEEDQAGGLMATEFLALLEDATVGDAIEAFMGVAQTDEGYHTEHVYVVSAMHSLIGVVPLADLMRSARSVSLRQVMSASPHVRPTATLDELKSLLDHGHNSSVPVIDERVRLLGVVTREAVDEAVALRSEEMQRNIQGIIGGDEIRTMPIYHRSSRRLAWLSINIVLNAIAASVIAFHQDTLSAVIALAVFLPIVSDMSGCSGNQAVAVSMRELSLGLVRPFEVMRVWLQEAMIGLINGVLLGCLLGLGAWLWKGNPYLGLVVGGALAVNSFIAVSIGGVLPLLLKRFGVDPAVASGPILTTVTDMCGFFLVLSFAAAALPQLTAH